MIESADRSKKINRVSFVAIIANVGLCILKLGAGLLYHSAALVSDAAHSLTDICSTMIVLIGTRLAKKQKDEDHQYGHEKYESIAGMLLSALLIVTGCFIVYNAISTVVSVLNGVGMAEIPGWPPLVVALISIAVKEFMYHYARRTAKAVGSTVLLADAWHQRLDALTSVGSLIGVGGALLGFPLLDPIASFAIALVVLKISFGILLNSIRQVTDKAMDASAYEALRQLVSGTDGVLRVDSLQTRSYVNQYCLDIRIAVAPSLTVQEAHRICHAVEDKIAAQFPNIKSCIVHVNPYAE